MIADLRDVYRLAGEELQAVEREMQAALTTLEPRLAAAVEYFFSSSGKRMRPLMTILSARLGQARQEPLVKAAAALELIHLGSLVHDDVVDEATTRRGQPSVNARFDNQTAVLLGDFFFARALTLAREAGSDAVQAVAEIISHLVEGELEQQSRSFDVSLTEADYWSRIERKTAWFLAESCRLGCIYGVDNPLQPDELHSFGRHLGLAYQVKDDLLDFVGLEEQVGKPTRRDLQDGVITLPVIHVLQHHPRREEIAGWITTSVDDNWAEVICCLRESGSLEFAEGKAAELVEQAKRYLAPAPEQKEKQALLYLADFVLTRVS
ncbi:MAG: polyprenyl synthetase family protein [Bacillota bacterium]